MDRKFHNILNQLTKLERETAQSNNINDLEKLIPLLLKRVPIENTQSLIDTIVEALKPLSSYKEASSFNEFFEQLKLNPKLLFETSTIDRIKQYIQERIDNDKQNLINKSSDLTSFVNSMQVHLNEAIDFSGNSTVNIHNIKEKIISINNDEGNKELLVELKDQLVDFSSNIEEEMTKVTDKLKDGKNKICELQEKIKNLEIELSKTKAESKRDYLTGLLTRRAFDLEMEKMESNFKRLNQNYAIILFDLDHFKKINDNFGHDAGDIVLSTFAKILNKSTRKSDIVCRFGGEEFLSLVHYIKKDEIKDYIKRIKNIIDNNSFVYKNQKIKVTFSAGVALRENFNSYKDSFKKADDLLYEAKEEGRNKIKF